MFSYKTFFSMHRVGKVPNLARGFAYPVDDWMRLDRFLILGSEGGAYYAGGRPLARQNTDAAIKVIKKDGERAVARIVEVSQSGRAPKNDAAVFALALAASFGTERTKRAAMTAIPKVCRTGADLFQFADWVEGFGGEVRALRRGLAAWYTEQSVDQLALQLVTCRERGARSHRDLLKLCHPHTSDAARKALFDWVSRDKKSATLPELVAAFVSAQKAKDAGEVAALIAKYGLPREAVPPEWRNDPKVWRALLERMPFPELIGNLGKLSSAGALKPLDGLRLALPALQDSDRIKKAGVHPLAILLALKTYAKGPQEKGVLTWTPAPEVIDALNAAFATAFATVEPAGRRILLALDISNSMAASGIAGTSLSPMEGAVAMALITAATEENAHILGFTAGQLPHGSQGTTLTPLPLTPGMRLDHAMRAVSGLAFGDTDCALPMLHALQHDLAVDAFVVYTDSDTLLGKIHPVRALREYRSRTGIPAKLVVVGMASSGFSIADPNDGGMLDVVGFDAAAPELIADFIRA